MNGSRAAILAAILWASASLSLARTTAPWICSRRKPTPNCRTSEGDKRGDKRG